MYTYSRRAFTLVEILVVVTLLGILAALVVPQFAGATHDAQTGNLRAQICEIQKQLELARTRATDGRYPDLVGDQFATFIADGYIRTVPRNPFNKLRTVAAAPAAADVNTTDMAGVANAGWAYHRVSGSFTACYWDEVNAIIDPNNP